MAYHFLKFRQWLSGQLGKKPQSLVAVLRLEGVIMSRTSVRGGLSLSTLQSRLDDIYSMPGLSAVALEINSPGGSPVQSALILDRIRDLAHKKDVPILAFCEDVAASGGYMLALAGDEIYGHAASIIGSIGVVSGGFGFPDLMEKLGIERRLYTAGDRKTMLDPFEKEKTGDVERIKSLQKNIHRYFINCVKKRRGRRLKGAEKDLFSGDIFTGEEALDFGLIDALGDMNSILRERFGDKVRFKRFEEKKPRLGALLGLNAAAETKAEMGVKQAMEQVEARLMWNRFGL